LHLDLKPPNIFINENKLLKIGDMGLCSRVGTAADEGDSRYMAEELLRENHVGSTKSDMFSVGVILLECAFNIDIPLDGEMWKILRVGKFSEIMDRLPESATQPIARSTELLKLLEELLSSNPDKRPSAEELLQRDRFHSMLERRKQTRENYLNESESSSRVVVPTPELKPITASAGSSSSSHSSDFDDDDGWLLRSSASQCHDVNVSNTPCRKLKFDI